MADQPTADERARVLAAMLAFAPVVQRVEALAKDVFGEPWLEEVNRQRGASQRPLTALDERSALIVLGRIPAISDRIGREWAARARQLNGILNSTLHPTGWRDGDAERGVRLERELRERIEALTDNLVAQKPPPGKGSRASAKPAAGAKKQPPRAKRPASGQAKRPATRAKPAKGAGTAPTLGKAAGPAPTAGKGAGPAPTLGKAAGPAPAAGKGAGPGARPGKGAGPGPRPSGSRAGGDRPKHPSSAAVPPAVRASRPAPGSTEPSPARSDDADPGGGVSVALVAAAVIAAAIVAFVALRDDGAEARARTALAVGVLEQTRDVGRLKLSPVETKRVLKATGDIEFDDDADDVDLACGKHTKWSLSSDETVDVCVLVEEDSGRLIGSFARTDDEPLAGTNCKGTALAGKVRCDGA